MWGGVGWGGVGEGVWGGIRSCGVGWGRACGVESGLVGFGWGVGMQQQGGHVVCQWFCLCCPSAWQVVCLSRHTLTATACASPPLPCRDRKPRVRWAHFHDIQALSADQEGQLPSREHIGLAAAASQPAALQALYASELWRGEGGGAGKRPVSKVKYCAWVEK